MTDQPQLRVLEGPKPAHLDYIVQKLEEYLEAAKRGEFEGGLIIMERADSEALTWSVLGTQNISMTLGRLRLLEDALITSQRSPA